MECEHGMTDLKSWDTAVKSWEKEAKEVIRNKHARLVSIFFDKLVENSPMFTGFYAANHKIVQKGQDSFQTHPAKAPKKKGILFDLIPTNSSNQKQKLAFPNLSDVLQVGSAVDYALNMENPTGGTVAARTGNRPVYINARIQAITEFNQEQGKS